MKNNLKYLIMLSLMIIVQFAINNFTIFYVDLFGVALVVTVLIGSYSWLLLIFISLLADLLSHWYLGTHLIAMVLINVMSSKVINFYRISNPFNKVMMAVFYYLLLVLIMFTVDLIMGRIFFSMSSLLFQVFIIVPIIQLVVHILESHNKSNSIFYD